MQRPDGADGLSRATMRISVGLFIGAAVAWMVVSGLLSRRWPWELYGDKASQSEVLKLALGLVAAGGAAVALVVNYRRQQHLERDDAGRRDEVRLFTERFGAAAAQLGGARPAVRLAGVYAMAALADEWDTQRQQCIDVLCGYLRLPYAGEPPPGHPEMVVEQRQYAGGTIQRTETTTHQAGEIQVRRAIVDTIRQHLQPTAQPSWSNLNFDFNGAILIDASFRGARFAGERTSFDRTTFSGNTTSFAGATFSGGNTSFHEAMFSAEVTWFDGATFSAEITWFGGATFSAEITRFNEATFSGKITWFNEATFSGKTTSFDEATFSGKTTSFDRVTFSGKTTSFNEATFSGKTTSFDRATFSGKTTSFNEATFSGNTASFNEATFSNVDALREARISAQHVIWGPVPPRSSWPPGTPPESS
ncbi:pentapeptide repeat-containing protein [Kribbella sp. CA-294648]|uniref:pentapeptide repeat-containing protein n=1 Tax=Kribbella sp. CA-294648 TaxID=3239948 RepID=UPI003D8C9632